MLTRRGETVINRLNTPFVVSLLAPWKGTGDVLMADDEVQWLMKNEEEAIRLGLLLLVVTFPLLETARRATNKTRILHMHLSIGFMHI